MFNLISIAKLNPVVGDNVHTDNLQPTDTMTALKYRD
jgi:hypothetical protein